ncbi:phosphotransferase family protein [Actinoplanes subglobosus]|uniref:Phosphotransferase family protein n=1 Tax=Actinoplanes subglobosus TaxID=1547892 RepID=A0ABV8INP8_9ACTN
MSRTVSLVLVDPAGVLLGQLPPFIVEVPWWQEVAGVVAGAGIDVTVLRLLHGDQAMPPGGHVTYLAMTDEKPAGLLPVDVDLSPHPLRASYAEPAGAAASLAWAAGALDRIGLSGLTARQQRTWNLSAIWRFDGPDGVPAAWLKQVPSFFAHEAAVLRLVDGVAPGLTPYVLAAGDEGRALIAHVPGEDRYGAPPAFRAEVLAALQPVQEHFAGRVHELRAAGIPTLSLEGLPHIAAPHIAGIPGLRELLDDLPRRLAAVDECGLPDTLVHGDLHMGNVIHDGESFTIVDWGDAAIGNPAFDAVRMPGEPEVLTAWAELWPGHDALRAAQLLQPVELLRQAVVYDTFMARIEPSEWPYHADDVRRCLQTAVDLAGQ